MYVAKCGEKTINVLNEYRELSVNDLMVNPANDRHGSLEDEIDAMNWLLADSKAKMKTLAKDIAEKGYVFAAPLVSEAEGVWVLHDGNRRVTCVKLLQNPTLANDPTWQRFFENLSQSHKDNIPTELVCRIEEEQEVIDDIVFRLHAGGESGVGTVAWKPHQQQNHSIRTGKLETPSLGIQIEALMKDKGALSYQEKLPIRNVERLLSSDKYRQQVGIEYKKGGNISFIYAEEKALRMLKKVCDDLIGKKVTIDGLIKNEQKDDYFKSIAEQGFTLNDNEELKEKKPAPPLKIKIKKRQSIQKKRYCLIPTETSFVFDEDDDLYRIMAIIEELQTLPLKKYINGVSVLFRVLIESCTDYYIDKNGPDGKKDNLAKKVKCCTQHMREKGSLSDIKNIEMLEKFSQKEEIFSAHTFNSYVHSHLSAPSEQHLCAMWDSFSKYVQNCIKNTDNTEKSPAP